MRPFGYGVAAACLVVAATSGCSSSEDDDPKPTPVTVTKPTTKTVQVEGLSESCREALTAAQAIARRVDYYPHLVLAAAQSETWPLRVIHESTSLTHAVAGLRRTLASRVADCLDS